MSYSITLNQYRQGCTLTLTDRAGQTEHINCHNVATAQAIAKAYKAKAKAAYQSLLWGAPPPSPLLPDVIWTLK